MGLPAARRLFALDHGFPQPIVAVLADYTPSVELVPIDEVDERMADLDDWEVLLALHHHHRPWDGLVTTDSGMVRTPESLAVLLQTKLTVVVAMEAGHDMLKATGLLFAYLRAFSGGPIRGCPALETPGCESPTRRAVGGVAAGSRAWRPRSRELVGRGSPLRRELPTRSPRG